MVDYILRGAYELDFGMMGYDVPPYGELPSPAKPKEIQISVCLSTWRRKKETNVSCLQSILNQGFPSESYEIILVDDASEGEHYEWYKEAVDYILKQYPNHNFRTYHTNYSRCWNDPHTLNVAFKRALGWIILYGQTDSTQEGEVLEAVWRHHNQADNIGLQPKHFAETEDGGRIAWPPQYYPEEHAMSIRKQHIHRVKGRNEAIKGMMNTAIVDFLSHALTPFVIYCEDKTVTTFHRNITPYRRAGHDQHPTLPRQNRRHGINRVWTDGDWGVLEPEEEKSVRMTEHMMKVLQNR